MRALPCLTSDTVFAAANLLPPYLFFNDLRCAMLRAAGAKVGPGARVDGKLTVSRSSHVPTASNIAIGAGTYINTGSHISARFDRVAIGSKCLIGPSLLIETSSDSTTEWDDGYRRVTHAPVRIGDRVWIGANVTVLPGVTIGDEAIVAIGAVVTPDVGAGTAVGGVPARVLRRAVERERQAQNRG